MIAAGCSGPEVTGIVLRQAGGGGERNRVPVQANS